MKFKQIKKGIYSLIIVCISILFFIALGCTNLKTRTFELSFKMNMTETFTSSDQLVIWLEKPDSTFVKTLFLSEYLAYGGFAITSICPDWSGRVNWKELSKEEFDAITGATPGQGDVKLKLEVEKDNIPDGEYNIFIEVHLAENYNELYSATINLSNKKCIRDFNVTFIPEKYSKLTSDHLSDVKISCK